MEEPSSYKNFDEKYKESIKYSINNNSYFRDAFGWFSTVYLRNIVDRTFFVFMSIMGIAIVFNVISLLSLLLPLEENIYITIKEKDVTKYTPNIIDLSKNKDTLSTDEDILKYLMINYIKERETHNYKTANTNDYNIKLQKIKNNSSGDVFNEFQYFMSRDNQNGPFYYFGKDIESKITINSFKFIRIERERLVDKIKDYFNLKLLPIRAEVDYTLNIHYGTEVSTSKRRAVINYKYTGVDFDERTEKYTPVQFSVTSYKNYQIN